MVKRVLTTVLLLLFILSPLAAIEAKTVVTPFKNEVLLSGGERLKQSVNLRNDGDSPINVSPIVFSYDPQNQALLDTSMYVFVKTDKEIFTIPARSSLNFNYEIIPPANLVPGTYFNLIVLKKESDTSFNKENISIGAIDSLSHLVVLHITDKDNAVYGISSDFALTNITIEEQGIPFIRPTRIKYIFQNITNYVLTPTGEIQVFNRKGGYPPTYYKIAGEGEKLYPGGTIEKTIEIDQIHLIDIISSRTIVGRFYNGIDENMQMVEVNQEPHYLFLGISITMIGLLIVLIKSIFDDKIKSKRKTVKP